MASHNSEKAKKERKEDRWIWLLYAALVVLVAAYALWNNIIIGFLAFLLIVTVLFAEFKSSVRNEGIGKSVLDIAIAVGAVIALWAILVVILKTSAPVDAVASCSMLPSLQRGDVVVVHGITNMSGFLSSHKIPVVNVSAQAFNSTIAHISSEWLQYLPYYNNSPSDIALSANPFGPYIVQHSNYSIGLYNFRCILYNEYENRYPYGKGCIENADSQLNNTIQYNYSLMNLQNGANVVVTDQISVANTTIKENYSNPIIVYTTTPGDIGFSHADIIHRLVAAINTGSNYYLLTKGDNNPYFDIQAANYPENQSSVIGYVIARAPALGYLRLIISGQLSAVPGCNETIQH